MTMEIRTYSLALQTPYRWSKGIQHHRKGLILRLQQCIGSQMDRLLRAIHNQNLLFIAVQPPRGAHIVANGLTQRQISAAVMQLP